MTANSSSEQGPEDSDSEFMEIDPTGRYGRYKEVLGKGAFKTVYRAFDELEGIEVAWNQVKVADLLRNSEDLEHLYSEVHLLKTLKHKNIIKFYSSWVDVKHASINFITEIFTSGTLRQYRKKHKHVDLRALKNWSRQILQGLLYLHSHDPPVIHRDLKCDNIFVNGNQGQVKIGDLGLAAILRQARSAHSVIGTPEYMAPELYEEEYNELVDIYAYGMCLLELVTFEYPYVECANVAQIYKKVMSGIKPASLEKVTDPRVREFIEKCIANAPERLSARELLRDPFLQSDDENESIRHSLPPNAYHSDGSYDPSDVDTSPKEGLPEASRDFMVQGQRKDFNTIFLKLRIADSTGHVRNIHFPFDIEVDTAIGVASEMVEELDLTDQDVTTIAAMIDSEIQVHIPEWIPREPAGDNFGSELAVSDNCDSGTKDELSPLAIETDLSLAKDELSPLANESCRSSGSLVLERFPSGRKYWSDSPKGLNGGSLFSHGPSNLSSAITNDRLMEDNGDYLSGDASPIQLEFSPVPCDSGNVEKNEAGLLADSQIDEKNGISTDHDAGNVSRPSEENCKTLMDVEPDYLRNIAEKLKYLVVEQQKELEELKQKHQMAISNLLKELPSEDCCRVFNMCNLKVPDSKTRNGVQWYNGHSTDTDKTLKTERFSSHVLNSAVDDSLDHSLVAPIAESCSPKED